MKLTPEQVQRIKSFPWKEEEEVEPDGPQPEYKFAEEVFECVDAIYAYIYANLKIKHLSTPTLFSIAIPAGVHRLLQEKYNPQWTDESRCIVFELIRGAVVISLDINRYDLEKLLEDIMNAKSDSVKSLSDEQRLAVGLPVSTNIGRSQSSYVIEWSRLYDEPVCIMDGEDNPDQFVLELGVKSIPLNIYKGD